MLMLIFDKALPGSLVRILKSPMSGFNHYSRRCRKLKEIISFALVGISVHRILFFNIQTYKASLLECFTWCAHVTLEKSHNDAWYGNACSSKLMGVPQLTGFACETHWPYKSMRNDRQGGARELKVESRQQNTIIMPPRLNRSHQMSFTSFEDLWSIKKIDQNFQSSI